MSNKHKHDKKANVINRTTTETLRLGEAPISLQPPQPRKKIQSSSSSFQITGVSMTRLDFGDDSADDLDESHTDDISRVTDNETPSFSEDSRDTDDHLMAAPEPQEAKRAEEAGARFKVVKVPSAAPFSRGRWTCFDFLDNAEPNLNLYSDQRFRQFDHNQIARPPSQAQVQTQDYISPHYARVHQDSNIANDPAGTVRNCFPQGYSSISEGIQTGIQTVNGRKDDSTLIPRQDFNKAANQPSNVNGQKDDILSDIKVALTSAPASNSGSAPNNNNIDRKIEEALDAVKTHLMVAVHKEVDFLKTRVSTLEGRVNELEIENSILRVNYLLFKS